MSSERPEELYEPPVRVRQSSDAKRDGDTAVDKGPSDDAARHEATTVLVRGEILRDQEPKSQPKDAQPKDAQPDAQPKDAQPKDQEKAPGKEISEAKIRMRDRLPALDDDADVGVQKEQIVIRDGKADLAFTGALLASAAPSSAPKGQWQEFRIYETSGGKHVFSKVTRSVFAEQRDAHEAEVFDPAPSSVPSQLLRSARDLTRTRPLTWMDAAVAFYGYDPLAKALYRKLSAQFEEHIG